MELIRTHTSVKAADVTCFHAEYDGAATENSNPNFAITLTFYDPDYH